MIRDLLFPTTDLAVAVQLGGLIIVATTAVWATRHLPDLRLLIVGSSVMLLALMGLRAAH